MTGLISLNGLLASVWPMAAGAIAVALASSAGTHWLDSHIYGDKISKLQLQSAQSAEDGYKKALDQFTKDSNSIHAAALQFQQQQLALQTQFSAVKEAFASATKAHALPPSCVPDTERLRVLAAAISAANSAHSTAGPGPSSPMPRPLHPNNH